MDGMGSLRSVLKDHHSGWIARVPPPLLLLRAVRASPFDARPPLCVRTDALHRYEEYVPVKKRRAMEEAKLRQLRGVSCAGARVGLTVCRGQAKRTAPASVPLKP